MKKTLIALSLALTIPGLSFADSPIKTETIDSLSSAQSFVKNGSYSKAIEEINYALSKINELTAEQLLSFIPAAPEGYTLKDKQSQGVGAGASIAGNAGANASYSGSNGSIINLNISIGGITGKVASLAALGNLFAGLSQEQSAGKTRQIRVQGYTGTENYNSGTKTGTLSFQVGDKISVTFEGSDINSPEALKTLAKSFDFSGLEKSF